LPLSMPCGERPRTLPSTVGTVAEQHLLESWERTRDHLARAWVELPPADGQDLAMYHEYLDHNELELAMDALASAGEVRGPSSAFWLALADAATEMKLRSKAANYRAAASDLTQPPTTAT
jgi:cytochrome c-type biogenesis protein CcmH/NrfG